jgi:ribosome-binding factor A
MVQKRGRHGSSPARFPRVARVNEVLREIIALELERIQDDDPRLELVTVTGIEADPDVKRATVYFSSLNVNASMDEVLVALNERRIQLQKVVGKNVSFKNTPQLLFKPDMGITEGQKVEDILRDIRLQSPPSSDD